MIDYGLKKSYIDEMVANADIELRDGVKDLLFLLKTKGVPVHIFSAGLYDIIHAYLKLHGLDGTAHVVSNIMQFDANEKLTGFRGEMIHTLNKNSTALRDSPDWDLVQSRSNVLLLGDNIGDVGMAKGLDQHNVLAVGFLNDREERLEEYKTRYDVVLLGDGNISFVQQLLQCIVNTPA